MSTSTPSFNPDPDVLADYRDLYKEDKMNMTPKRVLQYRRALNFPTTASDESLFDLLCPKPPLAPRALELTPVGEGTTIASDVMKTTETVPVVTTATETIPSHPPQTKRRLRTIPAERKIHDTSSVSDDGNWASDDESALADKRVVSTPATPPAQSVVPASESASTVAAVDPTASVVSNAQTTATVKTNPKYDNMYASGDDKVVQKRKGNVKQEGVKSTSSSKFDKYYAQQQRTESVDGSSSGLIQFIHSGTRVDSAVQKRLTEIRNEWEFFQDARARGKRAIARSMGSSEAVHMSRVHRAMWAVAWYVSKDEKDDVLEDKILQLMI